MIFRHRVTTLFFTALALTHLVYSKPMQDDGLDTISARALESYPYQTKQNLGHVSIKLTPISEIVREPRLTSGPMTAR
ncbi:uncharacterized protein BCR38DRAFT_418559 [Pseudomassariella vexata]|uniref:Uncharacterized protein n=1 Tax=Pseudomassariella vexata TaxID=1141098 RepID=A0A1Y2EKA5_9PEZI|nr:uncharacterized protein BCR38DRAFT_418559 [Pseudomassariella vexata]ORY71981.1 hypothetical protein BCR38DRAFT_418559 [Pseudomassariella vexata]